MSSRLRAILLVLVLGAQAIAALSGNDIWPLSSYPMFAELQSLKQMRAFRVIAITKRGQSIPIPYSNWPGWWNYIEFYLSEPVKWEPLKSQMLFDWQSSLGDDENLKRENIKSLQLIESYAEGDINVPNIQRRVIVNLDLESGKIGLAE